MGEKLEESLAVVGVTEPELGHTSTAPLPPPSRRHAYQFLLAASIIEAVLWGTP